MQAEDNGSAAPERRKREVSDWRSRIIVGQQVGVTELPSWLEASYGTLNSIVCAAGYPCFFGTQAERRGEMFYSYLHGKDLSTLPGTMATFARLADQPEYRRNNIAIFFEPDAQPLSHQAYHDHFWGTLQHLHDVDPDQQADFQPDPSDGAWEFSFGGVQMFVVCACPSFSKRHSRNLGPGMVLLFQPRAVFVDTITNKVIGREARNQVRERLRKWDDIEPHPDLGFYGDPGNLEWKQYFLDDANSPAADRCPFLNRARRAAQSADDSTSTRAESAGAGSVSRLLSAGGAKGATSGPEPSEQETSEAEAHAAHARPMSKWQPHSSAHHSGLSALPGPAPFVSFHGEQMPGEQGE